MSYVLSQPFEVFRFQRDITNEIFSDPGKDFSYVQSQPKNKRVVFGKNPTSLLFVVPFQGPQVKYSRCSIGADKLPTVVASNWHSHLSYAMPQSSIRRYSVLRSPVPKRKIARREASSSSEEVEYEQ